jgi:hypothetical protein
MGVFFAPRQRPAEGGSSAGLIGWRVVVALAILVLLFVGALLTAKTPEYTAISASLLRVFEIAFAGTLALLGIETAKS